MSHTPGPWEVVQTGDNPPSWNIWADAIADEDATLCHDLYSEADACLIAAAPDLLAACEMAESALDERIRGASEAFPQWAALLVEAHEQLRAAIAKARGDQP